MAPTQPLTTYSTYAEIKDGESDNGNIVAMKGAQENPGDNE